MWQSIAISIHALIGSWIAVAFFCNAHAANFMPSTLIEKSSLGTYIDTVPENMKIGLIYFLRHSYLHLNAKQIGDAFAIFDQACAPKKLRAMALDLISAQVNQEQGSSIISFLESPLGKRVVERERVLARPEIQEEIRENVARIINDLDGQTSRLALYASLDQAMESTRRAVDVYMASMLANNAAILDRMPDMPNKPSLAKIRNELESQRLVILASMSQAMLSNTAYAYRDLSESELRSYLQFALSPEGKLYFGKLGNIFAEVILKCTFDAGSLSMGQKKS